MRSIFIKISGFYFFYFAIVGTYVIFLPKILSDIGYSAFKIGIIFSTAPLVRFLLPFVIRKYLIINKEIFIYSNLLLFFSSFSFYLTIDIFWLFLFSNIFLGASMGIMLPFIETYAMEKLHKESYGKSRLFGSIGFILVSIILAENLVFPQAGIDFLLGSVIFTIVFSFVIIHKNDSFKSIKKSSKNSISLWRHKNFWASLILIQISFGGFYNFFTIYEIEHGISLKMVSFLWSFGVICEILFFYFQSSVLKRFSMAKLIQFATLITSMRWFILYILPNSLMMTFISQSFHAISFALLHSAGFLYLQNIYEDKNLSSQFYFGLTFGLGAFLGSIIAGITYGKYIYLICAFIAFVAFLTCKNLQDVPTSTY